MNMLVKSVRVLKLDTADTDVVFREEDEDGYGLTVLKFQREVWVDMERPTKITITLEPGDKLNVDES